MSKYLVKGNEIFNGKIPRYEGKIATATFTTDKTSLSGGVLTFNSLESSTDKLTLSGGGIRIGAGISKVLVSGNVFFQFDGTSNQGYLWMAIRKGSSNVSIAINPWVATYSFTTLAFTPTLVDVQEGDIFYIVSLEGKSGTYRSGVNSYLTIQVVN